MNEDFLNMSANMFPTAEKNWFENLARRLNFGLHVKESPEWGDNACEVIDGAGFTIYVIYFPQQTKVDTVQPPVYVLGRFKGNEEEITGRFPCLLDLLEHILYTRFDEIVRTSHA